MGYFEKTLLARMMSMIFIQGEELELIPPQLHRYVVEGMSVLVPHTVHISADLELKD